MNEKDTLRCNPQTMIERLESRGIPYVKIKKLVTFDLPHAAWYFESHFAPCTPVRALRQVERWRQLLEKDCILPSDQKREIESTLAGVEMFAWSALVESSIPRLGSWKLSWEVMPTQRAHTINGNADLRIKAVHQNTQEIRSTVIPLSGASATAWGKIHEKAFAELGLLEEVLKQQAGRRLTGARSAQGWPIFTQVVIPRLYDFLSPSYKKRGYVTSTKQNDRAVFSKELMADMQEILRLEYPDVFAKMTINDLKAAIQRHLAKSTRSQK